MHVKLGYFTFLLLLLLLLLNNKGPAKWCFLNNSARHKWEVTECRVFCLTRGRFLKAAGGYNDWPYGRGIYFNESKTFLVWINEEDHLRIISMQNGGDLGAVYKRLVKVSFSR